MLYALYVAHNTIKTKEQLVQSLARDTAHELTCGSAWIRSRCFMRLEPPVVILIHGVLVYNHYCIFHVTLQWSRSQHVSQPIFEASLLAQNFIDSSEILYIVTYIYYLGAPSTRNSNYFFLIFRFFTHNQIYSAESNASCMSLNMFYGPKKFICTL